MVMKYITITFDLLDDSIENEELQDEQFDNIYDYLIDQGFSDELGDEEYVPASVLVKAYIEGQDDIETIKNNLITFCNDKKIELESLMVTGPAEVATFFSEQNS